MRCKNCGSQWKSDVVNSSNSCPFCGRQLDNTMTEISSNINIIIKRIIDFNGIAILNNPNRFIALLSDLAPQLCYERKIFSIALNENVFKSFDDNTSEELFIQNAYIKLATMLSGQALDMFFSSIIYSLDWSIDIYEKVKNNISNSLSIRNSDILIDNSVSDEDIIKALIERFIPDDCNNYQYEVAISKILDKLKKESYYIIENNRIGESVILGGFEWVVVDKKEKLYLITSKTNYTTMPFCEESSKYCKGWEKSLVRKWLNNDFLSIFSADEIKKISYTSFDLGYKTISDRVFIMNADETIKYYGFNNTTTMNWRDRLEIELNPIFQNWGSGFWLRCNEQDLSDIAVPDMNKLVIKRNSFNPSNVQGVRPSMWVMLE